MCRMDRGLYVLSRHYHCFGLALRVCSASSLLVSLKPHSCEHVEEVTSYLQLYMFQLVLFSCRVLHGSSRRWRDVGSIVLHTWNCVIICFAFTVSKVDWTNTELLGCTKATTDGTCSIKIWKGGTYILEIVLRLTCYTLYVVHILYIEIHRDILHFIFYILHVLNQMLLWGGRCNRPRAFWRLLPGICWHVTAEAVLEIADTSTRKS